MRKLETEVKLKGWDKRGIWKEEIHTAMLYLETDLDIDELGVEWTEMDEECDIDGTTET